MSGVNHTDNAKKKVCRFFISYAGVSEQVNNVYDAGLLIYIWSITQD